MKRSEMCRIIEEYMTGPRHNATASTLLPVLEDAGMLPPKIVADSGYKQGQLVNNWEPENE